METGEHVVFLQKLINISSHYPLVCLKSEMSGIQPLQLQSRDILLKSLRAGWNEVNIILAPSSQDRDIRRTEVFLELGIQLHVRSVVIIEIKLDVFIPRAVHQCLV